MKKKPLISVIFPLYNVEKYVELSLMSVINQTYPNIEIIIVDDCSEDNSKAIVKKIIKGKNNIKLIELKKNHGLSFVRNLALKKSMGDYIGYIDSDDVISENYFESLMSTLVQKKADIVICDMNIIYENDSSRNVRTPCSNENEDVLSFINNGLAASACNKLFKRKIIEKYTFSEGKVNEDLAVVIPAIVHAKKVVYNTEVYYNYVQHENSIQNSKLSDKRLDIFYGVSLTLDRIKNYPNYEELSKAIIYQQLIMLLVYVPSKEPNIFSRARFLKKFYRASNKYEIRKNHFLWNFVDGQGTYHKLYYKLYLKLNCNGFSFLASILVTMFQFLRKFKVKTVIKSGITIQDLIELAKKQEKMKTSPISISVVIPNYNYAKFMYQRLYSILNQKVKLEEIIILDDCSTDDSKAVIDEIILLLSEFIKISKNYNKTNSGSPFKQWQKGFELAQGDYVWIAEADDYCDASLLKKITKPILKNSDVVISYAATSMINVLGEVFFNKLTSEIDLLKTGHWDKSYVIDGKNEVSKYAYLNNSIANVSSCIIKNGDYHSYFECAGKYRQAGDWLFYIMLMNTGKIAYCKNDLNYYRLHGSNLTTLMKKQAHLDEIRSVHEYIDNNFELSIKQKKEMQKRCDFLAKCWMLEKYKSEK